jgi:hypothetical protein
MLALHMAMPREGHLYAVCRVFAYLKAKNNSRLIFVPTYPKISHECFKADQDWEPFYGKMKEAIPPNAPNPRGRSNVLRLFIDSDHADNLMTRQSRTGFLQIANTVILNWHSNTQGLIEGATFGSEFVAA